MSESIIMVAGLQENINFPNLFLTEVNTLSSDNIYEISNYQFLKNK